MKLMLRFVIFLAFLLASIWVGVLLMRHPGYLLIVFHPWLVQMPIWLAILAVLLTFLLFYILLDTFSQIHFYWFQLKNWLRFRRQQKSFSKTQQGLIALIEGRYKNAERLLLDGISETLEPLINYLGAAKAAHERFDYEKRDRYLQSAYQTTPQAEIAIGLTQARLEFSQGQFERALVTLNHLKQKSPYHPGVLMLLEKIYYQLSERSQMLELLPNLRKAKIITNDQANLLEKRIYAEILQTSNLKSIDEIKTIWRNVPRHISKDPQVVSAYIKQLSRFPETNKDIEDLVRKVMKHHFEPDLVHIYSELPHANLNKLLVVVGSWLQQYGQKPELLMALGKLCMKAKLWGKAKDYFEKCLAQGPNTEASLAYGKLLEQLDELDAALIQYKDGLLAQAINKM